MGYMDNISPYISYAEATHTKAGAINKPSLEQVRKMKMAARMLLVS